MSPLQISVVILLTILGGTAVGMVLGRRLPPQHLSNDTKTVISASMAVVGTISALMLGLLISDASQAFSTRSDEIRHVSAHFIRLDRLLRRYGPDAGLARSDLRRYARIKLGDLFPGLARSKLAADNRATRQILEEMQDRLLALKPADDRQTW